MEMMAIQAIPSSPLKTLKATPDPARSSAAHHILHVIAYNYLMLPSQLSPETARQCAIYDHYMLEVAEKRYIPNSLSIPRYSPTIFIVMISLIERWALRNRFLDLSRICFYSQIGR